MEGSVERAGKPAAILAFRRKAEPDGLAAEAARRVERTGYKGFAAREKLTGLPVPPAILYLKMQIEFAAECLKAMDPPPENFRSDIFWPA